MSRATYAMPRAEIEAILRRSRDAETEATAERPKRSPSTRKATQEPSAIQSEVKDQPVSLPGRGGPQHKYLQSLVKRFAEDRGFKVMIEKMVLDGHGHVDVALERDGLSIGCEISVTTRVEQEVENLSKCLAAGFDYAVLVSSDQQTLARARTLLVDADQSKMRFISPEDLIAFLDEVTPRRPSAQHKKRDRDAEADVTETQTAPNPRMLIAKDAAAYLGVAQQTLAKMRWSGDSPPYFKVGRQVVYDRSDLDAWLALRKRRSTSDAGMESKSTTNE
jgi:predicted DNA-binding transcriptional regulator AlpA